MKISCPARQGNAAREKGRHHRIGAYEDVNGDGFMDLVVQFPVADLGLEEADTEATVTGILNDGTPFEGTDSVRIAQPADG